MAGAFELSPLDANERQGVPRALLPLHEAFRALPPAVLGALLLAASTAVLGIVQCALGCGRR